MTCTKTVIVECTNAANTYIDVTDASSELLSTVTVSSAADVTFGEVTIETSDLSFAPLSTFTCRSTYVLTDSLGTETTLIDNWVLNVKLNCEPNQLTLSGTAIADTVIDIFVGSLNTVTVTSSSVTSSILGCSITETFEIYDGSAWVELTDPTTYDWVQAFTNGASVDFGTTDYATNNGQVYDVRAKYTDPASLEATATIYDPFTVTFNFVCDTDVLSINAITDQTFNLGDSALTTAVTTG